jgi:hypothetical protein
MVLQANSLHFPPSNNKNAIKLDLIDWLKEIYLGLFNDGWKLNDIDEMDIFYYLDLTSYDANKKVKSDIKMLDDAGL